MSPFAEKVSRRRILAGAGATLAASMSTTTSAKQPAASSGQKGKFVFCLNTSTVRGQKLGIEGELDLAAKVGYQAVEPWLSSIGDYLKAGKSLKDLGKKISDLGLNLGSSIAFPQWIVDDDKLRAEGMEQAKRDMDAVAQIGGTRIAAPPAGAKDADIDLQKVVERYRALLELGDQMGVTPELEFWGHSKTLHTLGQAMYVAMETNHPKACILADVYHMYKGGTAMETLQFAGGPAIVTLHMNDYPADPPREKIDDSFRVFPGDGIAPISKILRTLHDSGANTLLSLELFNRDYWRQDSLKVAQMGLEKMKAVVEKALA